jgi:hypothetical protein
MNEECQKQLIEFMNKLAKSPEAIKDSQEKEQRIKELVNEFVNNSYDYFVTMHCERHVFPLASSTELDQRIQSLLELYERKLPYLMRNPDVVFQTLEHLEADNMVQNQIITGINEALRLDDESEEDVNDFIEKILTAFNKFKQQNKESK